MSPCFLSPASSVPWLTYAVIAFIVAALGVMLVTPEHRSEVTSTIGLALVISLLGIVLTRQHGQPTRSAQQLGKT